MPSKSAEGGRITEEPKDEWTSQRAGSSRKAKDVERGSNRRGTSSTLTAVCILTIILLILVLAGAAYLAYSHFKLMADVAALKGHLGETKLSESYGQKEVVTSIDLHEIHLQLKALDRAFKMTNETLHGKIHDVDVTLQDKLRKHITTMDVKAEERQKTETVELHELTLKVTALNVALQEMNDSIQGRIQAVGTAMDVELPNYIDSALRGNMDKVEKKMNATLHLLKTDIDGKVGEYKVEIEARITEAQQNQTIALMEKTEELSLADQNYTETLVSKAIESLKKFVWQQNDELAKNIDLLQNRTDALSNEFDATEKTRKAYVKNTIKKLNQNQTDRLDAIKSEMEGKHAQQTKVLNDKLHEINEKQKRETNKLNGGLQTLRTAVESQMSNLNGKLEGLKKTVESQNITSQARIETAIQTEVSDVNKQLEALRVKIKSQNITLKARIDDAIQNQNDSFNDKIARVIRDQTYTRNLELGQLREADSNHTAELNAMAHDLENAQLNISRCGETLTEVMTNQTKAHDELARLVMNVETKLTKALNETVNDFEESDHQLHEMIKTVNLTLTKTTEKLRIGIKRYLNEAADNF